MNVILNTDAEDNRMIKTVIENKLTIVNIVAIVVMASGIVGSYAIFGKDAVYARNGVDILNPKVSLNTQHRTERDYLGYREASTAFVTRDEWEKGENNTQVQLEILHDDIKLILQRLPE